MRYEIYVHTVCMYVQRRDVLKRKKSIAFFGGVAWRGMAWHGKAWHRVNNVCTVHTT